MSGGHDSRGWPTIVLAPARYYYNSNVHSLTRTDTNQRPIIIIVIPIVVRFDCRTPILMELTTMIVYNNNTVYIITVYDKKLFIDASSRHCKGPAVVERSFKMTKSFY